MARPIRKHGKAGKIKPRPLGEYIAADRRVLKVLDKHGITFCAGCYLTLFASPEKAAVYHAVPDVPKFLADLRKALRK
ncbi:MAG: hypothetical protein HY077_09895 [Elusimicrobia bacterium]|nr:hypothetical protein [Elusimicrobiota bacterium]